ncbi:hypothetical protein V6N13_143566 [Hibiscus sabdariffa]
MDPCPFVRLTVGNLALKIPVASRPALSVVHPSSSPCFCKIKLKNFPLQTAVVPYIPPENQFPDNQLQTLAATFHLSKADVDKLAEKSIFSAKPYLKIAIYTGRGGTTCGFNSGRLLGKVSVRLDLAGTESRVCVFHNGWISVGKEANKGSTAQFHLNVKAEPDPRFVFHFDGEPECSPQVFQIRGNIRQPVFTCKFSFRNTGDRNQRSSRGFNGYPIRGFAGIGPSQSFQSRLVAYSPPRRWYLETLGPSRSLARTWLFRWARLPFRTHS